MVDSRSWTVLPLRRSFCGSTPPPTGHSFPWRDTGVFWFRPVFLVPFSPQFPRRDIGIYGPLRPTFSSCAAPTPSRDSVLCTVAPRGAPPRFRPRPAITKRRNCVPCRPIYFLSSFPTPPSFASCDIGTVRHRAVCFFIKPRHHPRFAALG